MIYTAFCRDITEVNGTIWIDTVIADSPNAAANLATGLCADDWEREDDENIVCMGVIEGEVNVLLWDDEDHCA